MDKISDLYLNAQENDEESLLLLLDFLLFEKQTVKPNDPISVLDLYFAPKHKDRMNQLLKVYKEGLKDVG